MADENTRLTFGMHKGEKLGDVPASYLLYLWDENKFIPQKEVDQYIQDNYEVLKAEVKRGNNS